VAITPGTIVFISPAASHVPEGRCADPDRTPFGASWQRDERNDPAPLEDYESVGAAPAIAWARERSGTVLIRLGSTYDTTFWAGAEPEDPSDPDYEGLPVWPPAEPPAEGWWTLDAESG
jgi:hypothetical protein